MDFNHLVGMMILTPNYPIAYGLSLELDYSLHWHPSQVQRYKMGLLDPKRKEVIWNRNVKGKKYESYGEEVSNNRDPPKHITKTNNPKNGQIIVENSKKDAKYTKGIVIHISRKHTPNTMDTTKKKKKRQTTVHKTQWRKLVWVIQTRPEIGCDIVWFGRVTQSCSRFDTLCAAHISIISVRSLIWKVTLQEEITCKISIMFIMRVLSFKK